MAQHAKERQFTDSKKKARLHEYQRRDKEYKKLQQELQVRECRIRGR